MKFRLFPINFLEERKNRKLKYRATESGVYMALLPIVWLSFFFMVPVLIILKISLSESIFAMPPFSEIFSYTSEWVLNVKLNFNKYIAALHDSYYIAAFINSVLLGAVATITCFVIGFPMAYGIHHVGTKKTKLILLLMVARSFWTSFLVRIYSWINILSVHGVLNSALLRIGIIKEPLQFLGNYYVVCLGLIFCYLPFMIFPIYSVLEKEEKTYIESAYDLGCTPFRAFWRITIPLSIPGVLSGCIMVFAASSGEFVIPELLGSADTITFGRVLWTEFYTNLDWPMACALSTIMILFIMIPIYVFQKKSDI
jgi:putrescine transport system permease protein